MAFETKILNKVAEVLGNERLANFFNGTLFVDCNEIEARSVYHRLAKEYPGCIRISVVDTEYAFDFVVPADRPVKQQEEIYSPYHGAL